MDDRYFIILGASIDQKTSIITANKLGFKTIVFDKNPNAECRKYAHKFFDISSTNFSSIIGAIKKYKKKIKGVIAQGSDIPVIVSKLELYLGIKNRVPLESAIICSNKRLMKNFFIKHNIPSPPHFLKTNNLKFPVVVKPVDMSGAKGVFLCKNENDLKKFSIQSKKISLSKKIIIEDFYNGTQLSTESLIINEKSYTYGFAERNYADTKGYHPNILENGGIQPAQKLISYKSLINDYIQKISKYLKIKNGVIKSDIVLNNNKIYFIEIALRLSGGDFSETLIPKSNGINIIRCAIKNAAGIKLKTSDLKEKKNVYFVANRYFFSRKNFEISKYTIPKKIKDKKWLIKIKFSKNKNIVTTKSHSDRFGVFIVRAKTIQTLYKRIKYIYEQNFFTLI